MAAKTWNEMTEEEQAEVLRSEDERESYDAFLAREEETPEVSDADLDEHLARTGERLDGHKDHWFW